MITKRYRETGAQGALLDEYEKAVRELQRIVQELTEAQLATVVDQETKDPDCHSIKSVLMHVISSGHNYVVEIRNSNGEQLAYFEHVDRSQANDFCTALDELIKYNEQLFEDYPDLKLDAFEPEKKIRVRWGQLYDVEQLLEHAIVHILRHRRQVERFVLLLRA